MEKKYLHTGYAASEKMDGMSYLESLKVWIGYNAELDAEFLYWEPGTPMPAEGYASTHIAFEVKDINEAIALPDTRVILPPFDVGPMIISYVKHGGIVVEWVQKK